MAAASINLQQLLQEAFETSSIEQLLRDLAVAEGNIDPTEFVINELLRRGNQLLYEEQRGKFWNKSLDDIRKARNAAVSPAQWRALQRVLEERERGELGQADRGADGSAALPGRSRPECPIHDEDC